MWGGGARELLDLTIRRGFAVVAVLLLGWGLGACSSSSLSDFQFGKANTAPPADPAKFPADYKPEIAAFMRKYLENPTKVRDAYIATPVMKPVGATQQYITCVRYNSRNSTNQYEGNKQNLVIFLSGQLNQFLPDDPQMCAGLAYQRYPEIENMVP
jgi:hypothetical protein